jgi:hypothetical protein
MTTLPFSERQLAFMRARQESKLPDTCLIEDYTSVADDAGGTVDTWGTPVSSPCRLGVAIGAREGDKIVAGQQQNASSWVITLPNGRTVSSKSRITIGVRVFQVIKQLDHSWNTVARVNATEIT